VVEEAEPEFTGVGEAFPVLRHQSYYTDLEQLAREHPEMVKATIKWEIAEAARQSAVDVARASKLQDQMWEQSRRFFAKYDFFILPVTQLSPFDATTEYPTSINGTKMDTYIDWMRSCWYVTFMASPAASVPAGFTKGGLPVGIQIVGRARDDWGVLQMAHAFETATKIGNRAPVL
jgi:amidase